MVERERAELLGYQEMYRASLREFIELLDEETYYPLNPDSIIEGYVELEEKSKEHKRVIREVIYDELGVILEEDLIRTYSIDNPDKGGEKGQVIVLRTRIPGVVLQEAIIGDQGSKEWAAGGNKFNMFDEYFPKPKKE